ncbi:MAG: diphosphomevalonate decarboxylase [Myxococcota bacterium]
MEATAVAHPNIALVKYWGKRDIEFNLPAAGSVSMTLGGLETRTHVEFDPELTRDQFELDGAVVEAGTRIDRVSGFLDLIRERAGIEVRARVVSANNFPTAAGLASSASGFAALAVAAAAAAGLQLDDRELSVIARRGSGSAARSIYGGFVEMRPGEHGEPAVASEEAYAQPIAPPEHWDLQCLVAVTVEGEKDVGSTEGMNRTERTSPYFPAWVESVPDDIEAARVAIEQKDFAHLAAVAERSCLRMHASAIGAEPGVLYWRGTTVDLIHRIREARASGTSAFFTIDAGPHVKVFCPAAEADDVRALLEDVDGVRDVLEAWPGDPARLVDKQETT